MLLFSFPDAPPLPKVFWRVFAHTIGFPSPIEVFCGYVNEVREVIYPLRPNVRYWTWRAREGQKLFLQSCVLLMDLSRNHPAQQHPQRLSGRFAKKPVRLWSKISRYNDPAFSPCQSHCALILMDPSAPLPQSSQYRAPHQF